MSYAIIQAAKLNGPINNPTAALGNSTKRNILVLPITASTVVFDILGPVGTPETGLLPRADGRVCHLDANVDTYYMWTNDSGAVIDETKTGTTNPEQQAPRMLAGQVTPQVPQGRYLAIKGAVGLLRIHVASP